MFYNESLNLYITDKYNFFKTFELYLSIDISNVIQQYITL